MISREPIYAALYAKLADIRGFRTVGRRFRLWNDVEPEACPALFFVQAGETAQPRPGGAPTQWTLAVDVVVYTYQGDETASPMPQVNELLDAIEQVIAPDDLTSNLCTLGGLVHHVWIEGAVDLYEGTLNSYSIAVVPLRLLAV